MPEHAHDTAGRTTRSPAGKRAAGTEQQDAPKQAFPVPAVAAPTVDQGVLRRERASVTAADPLAGMAVGDEITGRLDALRGRGQQLPTGLADRLGEHLGTDLSGVRVHDDTEAATLSRSLQARAFTHGTDIYFGRGNYAPHTSAGRRLLAHELSHVAHQDGAGAGPVVVGAANDPAEARADATADRVVGALNAASSPSTAPEPTAPPLSTAPEPTAPEPTAPEPTAPPSVPRSAALHREIDLTTPPGTRVKSRHAATVIGVVKGGQGGDVLQIRFDSGGEMLLSAKAMQQYNVIPTASPTVGVAGPTGLSTSVSPTPSVGSQGSPSPSVGSPTVGSPSPTPSVGSPTPTPTQGSPTPTVGSPTPSVASSASVPMQSSPVPTVSSTPSVVSSTPSQGGTASVSSGPAPVSQVPGPLNPTQLATLTVDVPDTDLDAGSKLLKDIRAARPTKVNDSAANKLSNCAIVTVAAIVGGKTSGQATKDVRAALGIPPSTTPPARMTQSEKLWTIGLLDAETLKKGDLINERASERTAGDLSEMPMGGSYVVGSAQYHMMIGHLLALAKSEGTGQGLTRSVHRHGLPGADMEDEATLIAAMNKYPNGTRFAVFLHSSDQTQAVGAHWLYAERFNGKVIFQDFQTNTADATPADAYLEKFPFSPNKVKDRGKGFQEGSFIALAVTQTSSTPPTFPDPEVSETVIQEEIALAREYAVGWSAKAAAPKQLASSWTLPGSTRADTIPAPTVVQHGFAELASDLGVTASSSYDITRPGVISIVGHPHAKTIGRQTKVEFDNLNASTKVKQPGQAAALDSAELAAPAQPTPAPTPSTSPAPTSGSGGTGPTAPLEKFSEAATDNQYTAFSKAFNVMAQNTSTGIEINADRGAFTDLIHEAAHGYEKGRLPNHIREGLADIFASMVSMKIMQTHSDPAFEFDYNPSYAPFVVKAEALIAAVGLPAMARVYFQDGDSKAGLVREVTAAGATGPDAIVDQLLSENFPSDFDAALSVLTGPSTSSPSTSPSSTSPPSTGPTPSVPSTGGTTGGSTGQGGTPSTSAASSLFATRKASFATMLEAKRAGLETKGLRSGASMMELAQELDRQYGKDVMEQRLRLLYTHLKETAGEAFTETLGLVQLHEMQIGQVTGEDADAVRLRISGSEKLVTKA